MRASWEIWRASRRVIRGGLEGYLGIWRPIQGNPRGDGEIEPGAKRHHMVSGTLAPLYTVFGLKLDCSGAAALIGDEVL